MSQTFFSTSKPLARKQSVDDNPNNEKKLKSDDSTFDQTLEHNASVLKLTRKSFQLLDKQPLIIAAFDLDGTLISTKSGNKFARNGDDWKLLPQIKEKLTEKLKGIPHKQLIVVLFTNQGGVVPRNGAKSFVNIIQKLTGVGKTLTCIDMIYASMRISDPTLKLKYRKPGSGMFDSLKSHLENLSKDTPLKIDMAKSFYVGDAAGRQGDHSADDKEFAANAKLTFYTPEEYFGIDETVGATEGTNAVKDVAD